MYCPSCGMERPDDSRACPHCGTTIKGKPPTRLKAVLIGLLMGVVGSLIGFYPILLLHNKLNPLAMQYEHGSLQRFLLIGFPMYIAAVVFLPAAGAVVGMLGASIGYLRKSPRIWLWGLLAGFLLNLFVSFWAM